MLHRKHCLKSVQITSFFWSGFSRIQSEYGKVQTGKNSVFGHFSHSEVKKRFPQKEHFKTRLNKRKTYLFKVFFIISVISFFPLQYVRCCPT